MFRLYDSRSLRESGKKVLNVPAIRFPEFTGEWKIVKVGTITTKVGSGVTPRGGETIYRSQGHPFVRSQNVGWGRLLLNDIAYIDEETHKKQLNTALEQNDVLLNITGASIGRCAIVNEMIVNGNVNQHVCIIRSNGAVDSEFLCNYLLSNYGQKQIDSFQAGGNRQGLNFEQIKSIRISIPTLDEQKHIAKLLCAINQRIETQNKIIEDLKKLRSAIADKLYSSAKGVTYSFRQLFDVVNEKNKKLTYSNVLSASQELGMIERSDINKDIKFEQDSISGYKIVRRGDYVVHLRSFQGGFAFSDKTGICSPAYTILRPNNLVAYSYLSHFFTSKPFVKSLKLVTYGIRDGRSINVDEWLDMTVILPTMQEQLHIISVINSIDNKLYDENQIHNCLLRQRTYLLKAMFI